MLTKAVGHALTTAGFEYWYWGCEIGYMSQYRCYGAHTTTRAAYYERLRELGPLDPPERVEDVISSGRGLIAPREAQAT